MHTAFFAVSSEPSGLGTLGINGQAFLIQLVTFLLFFVVLEKLAIKPLLKRLNARREVVDDGVKLGLEMQKEKAHLASEVEATLKAARTEADNIIAEGKKESRELIKQADEITKHKSELLLQDAKVRIEENTARARRELENDIALLVGEAAEVVVGEKLDPKKDAELIKKAMKQQVSV